MIDILIGIGILIVVESILILIITRCPPESRSTAIQIIQIISIVSALAVGMLLLIAIVSLAFAFIAHALPEFAEMMK